MKKAAVIGHYGFGFEYLDGQTVKTKIITAELECRFSEEEIVKVDTHGGKKKLLTLPFTIFKILRKCQNVIILPAHNGLRAIAPILVAENHFFHRKLHYVVIGGWLPEFLKNKKFLAKQLKRFDGIYVETSTMKKALEAQGFQNVVVMPNCKKLHILDESELVYFTAEPYKLCTFSRVMKEKGIEDAVEAVRTANTRCGRTVFSLDIYGQVDSGQTEWFDELQKDFPDYVKYGGIVPFDQSVDVLKVYFALLFPTYYAGEGFAGTLIDAMAAGIPVIASDWKYNHEVVVRGKTGILLENCNKNKLANQLLCIAENPQNWNSMKALALKEAEKYRPEKAIEPLMHKIGG